MPQPSKIPLAFAASGDKNIIPESTETTGLASWRDGFPAITSAPFSEGGIAPKRADFNGIFNALSLATVWQQQGGFYAYDNATDYEVGNVVLYSGDLYKCLSANGPSSAVKAPTDAAVWAKVILTTATQSAAGYMSAADKTKVDSVILTNATQSAAGYMSAADKTALDNVPTTYFPLAGGTITGQTKIATSNNGPGIFQIVNSSITKGTAPNNTVYASLGFFGADQTDYTRRLGVLETVYNSDKSVSVLLGAYKANTATDTEMCTISCNIDAAGNVATYAPTPATTDNSTKIATTEFVENRLNYIEYKSLTATGAVDANYSSCAVQGHVCYISLSFDLSATPTNWSEITIFKSPVLPKLNINGAINNQHGTIGGLYLEILVNGDVNLHFTGGPLPTNSYYHGILVFPC